MMDALGGRKFIGFLFITVLLFALVFSGKLDVNTFVAFITANFGIFVTGNSIEKITNMKTPDNYPPTG
jgi:hypothetical protein